MLKWLDGLLDSNEREIKRLKPLVARINSLEPDLKRLTDAELRGQDRRAQGQVPGQEEAR